MKKICLFFGLIGLLFSCSDSDSLDTKKTDDHVNFGFSEKEKSVISYAFNEKHTITIDQARQKAEDVANFLASQSNVTHTKAAKHFTSQSVITIKTPKTRTKSGIEDSSIDAMMEENLAYIVDFGKDNGYAMIAADERVEESVLMCVIEGNIPEDFIPNSNEETADVVADAVAAIILDNVGEYVVTQLEQAQVQEDLLMNGVVEKLEATLPSEYQEEEISDEVQTKGLFRKKKKYTVEVTRRPKSDWQIIALTNILLPVEWSQNAPYNENVKNKKSCGTVPTGCVATAAAQIIAYWNYPASIEGITFDWRRLTAKSYISNYDDKDLRHQVAHLMERIGKHTGMKYKCNSSGTKTYKARNYMRSLGYSGGTEAKYNFNAVVNSLNNNRPVLASGDRKFKYVKIFGKKVGWTHKGHAWVIDGYVKKKREIEQITVVRDRKSGRIIKTEKLPDWEYSSFIHNNWGWANSSNGWFAEGSFDSNNPESTDPLQTKSTISYDDSDDDDDYDDGESGNYRYHNKIYYNLVAPNKR